MATTIYLWGQLVKKTRMCFIMIHFQMRCVFIVCVIVPYTRHVLVGCRCLTNRYCLNAHPLFFFCRRMQLNQVRGPDLSLLSKHPSPLLVSLFLPFSLSLSLFVRCLCVTCHFTLVVLFSLLILPLESVLTGANVGSHGWNDTEIEAEVHRRVRASLLKDDEQVRSHEDIHTLVLIDRLVQKKMDTDVCSWYLRPRPDCSKLAPISPFGCTSTGTQGFRAAASQH